jgi:hypothetical protein
MRDAPADTRFIFNLLGATIDEAKQWLDRMRQASPRMD